MEALRTSSTFGEDTMLMGSEEDTSSTFEDMEATSSM
jgi:hypothetical protein